MYYDSFQKLLETKYIVLIYFFLLRISFQHRGTFALVINLVCSVFINTPMSIYNGIYWFYSFLRLMCTYTNVQNNTNYFSIIITLSNFIAGTLVFLKKIESLR